MMSGVRDTLAIIFLDKRLAAVRERIIELSLSGSPPAEDFMGGEEQRIMDEMRQRFYSADARGWAVPAEDRGMTDQDDYDGRGTRIAEAAVLRSHRILASIPWVGDRAFEDR